jgi:hypothetical protein
MKTIRIETVQKTSDYLEIKKRISGQGKAKQSFMSFNSKQSFVNFFTC